MGFKPAHAHGASGRLLLAAVVAFCLLPTAFCQTSTSAQISTPDTTDARIGSLLRNLGRVRTPTSATISPDGRTVAWTVDGTRGSELHLTNFGINSAQAAESERIISPDTIGESTNNRPGACDASHPTWSPDGKHLALVSNCSGGGKDWEPSEQNNIFVWTPAGNGMKQVTRLHGSIGSVQWSPNGKSIAFLYVENATRQAGATDAMKPWSGVYDEDGVEVQGLAVADPSGKHLNLDLSLLPPDLHVYEFTWAPDSTQIAFIASPPPGENNWWVAKLYIRLLEPLEECDSEGACSRNGPPLLAPAVLVDPTTTSSSIHGLQIAVPRFSPDGKQIAFIGGLMSDQGQIGGNIYVAQMNKLDDLYDIRFNGVTPKDITPDRPATPAWITWLDNNTLGISEHVGGGSHLTALDARTGKDDSTINLTLPETIVASGEVMSVSTSRTDNVALIRQSYDHPPEVWAGPLKNLKQITHLNDALKPAWGKAESIDYTNEGFHIQGWLLYPAGWSPNNGDPAKKYPLIVSVHGGPSGVATPRWPTVSHGAVPFSALGYFVFLPNPRGSYGQGEKFTQANIRDFGYGDMRDVLAGVDVIEKRFPIDKQREGLTGWSYGGFMTMFGVTQTTRFRAAVAGAGISNWQSYYGENSIDQWMIPFFGATVYDDPAIYAKSSAIDFIKQVKTPTLVVVGDRDGECPAPQSFEFWHALKAEGVKTQLVIYPSEGHQFSNPDHQRDVLKRALDWFQTEMPPN